MDFFVGNELALIEPDYRRGGHFSKRVGIHHLPLDGCLEEHPGELEPLVDRGRSKLHFDQAELEVFGVRFRDCRQVTTSAEVVNQVLHHLRPYLFGRRLDVDSAIDEFIQELAQRGTAAWWCFGDEANAGYPSR